MAPEHLLARQTPVQYTTTWDQPTAALALSTTFTPPASCALPSQISILPSPGYLIWWNEPVPYPGQTVSDCYPSEFLRSYTSLAPSASLALGSSIVPAMSPLVCPQNYCTQYVGDDNYIACCPSGYKFATTGSPVVASRPAYGGVCYTDIPKGEELTAVVYDSKGSAHQQVWAPSTTGAQGWAHPIDGWAASDATAGCAVEKSLESISGSYESTGHGTSSQRALSSIVASTKGKAKKASGGMIAGVILGALVVLIAILGLVLFLLRRRKRAKESIDGEHMPQNDSSAHIDGTQVFQKEGDEARVEVNAVPITPELGTSKGGYAHEMAAGQRVIEMPAGPVVQVGER